MKNVLLLLLAITFLIAGCAPKKPTEKTVLSWGTPYFGTPEALNGKVKELKHITYWAIEKDGKVEKGAIISLKQRSDSGWSQDFTAYFNEGGLLTRCDYLGDNSVIQSSVSTEIENGKIVKEKWSISDTLRSIANFKFDEKGHIVEVSRMSAMPDTLMFKYLITNNEKGNPILGKILITTKEVFNGKSELKWDENGRVIETVYYNSKDSLTSRMVMTYNKQGFLETQKFYNKTGKLTLDMVGTSTFDEKGNWLTTIWKKSGKPYAIEERTCVYY